MNAIVSAACVPEPSDVRSRELAKHVARDDEVGRPARSGDVPLHPASLRQQLAAGGDHLRLDLDERQLLQRRPRLERRPRRDARPGADVEQRARLPVGPLPRHLPEDGRRCRVRRRSAVGEVGGHLRPRSRRPRRRIAAVGRRQPLDLRRDRAACARDELFDRRGEPGRKRGQEGRAASTSSAWLSGFTRRSSLATLPSASMMKVERSTPM